MIFEAKWITFDEKNKRPQTLPPPNKYVAIQLKGTRCMPPSVVVGYLKNSKNKHCPPTFITPGVHGYPVAWSDCLPETFKPPLWDSGKRISNANYIAP